MGSKVNKAQTINLGNGRQIVRTASGTIKRTVRVATPNNLTAAFNKITE